MCLSVYFQLVRILNLYKLRTKILVDEKKFWVVSVSHKGLLQRFLQVKFSSSKFPFFDSTRCSSDMIDWQKVNLISMKISIDEPAIVSLYRINGYIIPSMRIVLSHIFSLNCSQIYLERTCTYLQIWFEPSTMDIVFWHMN